MEQPASRGRRRAPVALRHVARLVVVALLGCACSSEAGPTPVEFGGSECVSDLPASVAPGDYTFVLTNTSDRSSVPVYVVKLLNGRQYDDFSALQPSSGDYFVLPNWAEYALRDFVVDDANSNDERQYRFTLEPGDHAVYLWASRPAAIWLCGSLSVTR